MTISETFKLTIFTEASIESILLQDLERLRVPGYTITNARGKGSRGVRSGSWSADANIRVEVICEERLANEIAEFLQENYYKNFAMVITIDKTNVFRPSKFER